MTNHSFSVNDKVRFTPGAKKLLSRDKSLEGVFHVAEVIPVPKTCYDPYSEYYMDEREGQDAVGHHQMVILRERDTRVSGMLIEPA